MSTGSYNELKTAVDALDDILNQLQSTNETTDNNNASEETVDVDEDMKILFCKNMAEHLDWCHSSETHMSLSRVMYVSSYEKMSHR